MKDKRGAVNIGPIIVLFVGIVIGIVFLVIISTSTASITTLATATNETFNLTSSGCYDGTGWVNTSNTACNYTVTYNPPKYNFGSNCPTSSLTITNKTGSTLTVNTDYILYSSTGIVSFLNTTGNNRTNIGGGNITYISYQYCPYGYAADSGSRSVVNIITLIATLGLLAFAIYYVWKQGWFENFGKR